MIFDDLNNVPSVLVMRRVKYRLGQLDTVQIVFTARPFNAICVENLATAYFRRDGERDFIACIK